MTKEEYIKNYKEIEYCEILIKSDGEIILSRPSHTEALITLSGLPREILNSLIPTSASPIHWLSERFNTAAVWYKQVLFPKDFTIDQLLTLYYLIYHGAVSPKLFVSIASEFSHYLNREKEDFIIHLDELNREVKLKQELLMDSLRLMNKFRLNRISLFNKTL